MSNYANRNSRMPDTSLKPRSDFGVRNRTIAIMLAAAFIAAITLGIGALLTHNNPTNERAPQSDGTLYLTTMPTE